MLRASRALAIASSTVTVHGAGFGAASGK